MLKLVSDFDKLLSTLLIGNNIVNIAVSSIGTVTFIRLLNDSDKGASVSTIVVTVVVLIFGEITPKSIAKEAPESFARFSAPLLRVFMWVLMPLSWVFGLWKKLVAKLFRVKGDRSMTQEELSVIVDEAGEGGGIDSDEVELLRSALEFTEQEPATCSPLAWTLRLSSSTRTRRPSRPLPQLALFTPACLRRQHRQHSRRCSPEGFL